jgi:hypothetical protein
LIAGATEMENGVDNLWKKDASMGSRNHPDFGKYMAKNMLKAFKSAAIFSGRARSIGSQTLAT